MSYLSASENVGFSGISQNITDASCATQYKLAVEGVAGSCSGEVNMFMQDSSGDEQSYITHLNDNFFHTKFKIDPNELYTFQDSDVIASEITVSHTEDAFIFSENVDAKSKALESPTKEINIGDTLTNGDVNGYIKVEIPNGHRPSPPLLKSNVGNIKDERVEIEIPGEQNNINYVHDFHHQNLQNSKFQSQSPLNSPVSTKNTPSSSNKNNVPTPSITKISGQETFLDVFKREQGLDENGSTEVKVELSTQPIKIPVPTTKKSQTSKAPPSQAKPKRGRGPAVHEALQRIPTRKVVPIPIKSWHAPGQELFECGPLADKRPSFKQVESSSDDDNMPDFDSGLGPVCVEEMAAESRGARLALRRAALRRHVARVGSDIQFSEAHKKHKFLASTIKKQLQRINISGSLPTQTVNHLLAMRGMTTLLSSRERRLLRESGWSGGTSGSLEHLTSASCAEENCTEAPLPCGRYCLSHVTLAPEQRLYASCAAVFAGGSRCKQPLLPLQDQTPLCAEHAWKRDNYDKIARDCRPKKAARKRVWAAPTRPPRRAKKRRRPPPPRPAPAEPNAPHTNHINPEQSLSEINVCSNSSAYDSSEDATMGTLSDSEYIAVVNSSHELVEVEQVPHDDILDPSVLSQIPDEAFTEFFNQAAGENTFAESSELTAALEAVLDERGLDERALDERALEERALEERVLQERPLEEHELEEHELDERELDESELDENVLEGRTLEIGDTVFVHTSHALLETKIQSPSSVPMEISTSVPS